MEAIALGIRDDMFQILHEHPTDILIVSALPPFALTHARSLCRKARRSFPQLKIALGLWGSTIEIERIQERLGSVYFDNVVTSIVQVESLLGVSANSSQLETDDVPLNK